MFQPTPKYERNDFFFFFQPSPDKAPSSKSSSNGKAKEGKAAAGGVAGGVVVAARIEPVIPNDIQEFLHEISFQGYVPDGGAEKVFSPAELKWVQI